MFIYVLEYRLKPLNIIGIHWISIQKPGRRWGGNMAWPSKNVRRINLQNPRCKYPRCHATCGCTLGTARQARLHGCRPCTWDTKYVQHNSSNKKQNKSSVIIRMAGSRVHTVGLQEIPKTWGVLVEIPPVHRFYWDNNCHNADLNSKESRGRGPNPNFALKWVRLSNLALFVTVALDKSYHIIYVYIHLYHVSLTRCDVLSTCSFSSASCYKLAQSPLWSRSLFSQLEAAHAKAGHARRRQTERALDRSIEL